MSLPLRPTQELESVMDLWYKQENDALHKQLQKLNRKLMLAQHIVEMNRHIINNTREERNTFRRILESVFNQQPDLANDYDNIVVFHGHQVELIDDDTEEDESILGQVIDEMMGP